MESINDSPISFVFCVICAIIIVFTSFFFIWFMRSIHNDENDASELDFFNKYVILAFSLIFLIFRFDINHMTTVSLSLAFTCMISLLLFCMNLFGRKLVGREMVVLGMRVASIYSASIFLFLSF